MGCQLPADASSLGLSARTSRNRLRWCAPSRRLTALGEGKASRPNRYRCGGAACATSESRDEARGLALGYSFSFSFLSFLDTFEAKKTRHGPRARASRSTALGCNTQCMFEIESRNPGRARGWGPGCRRVPSSEPSAPSSEPGFLTPRFLYFDTH